jgi:hypothetical protein
MFTDYEISSGHLIWDFFFLSRIKIETNVYKNGIIKKLKLNVD